jgi:hypothetical protein
MSISCGRFDGLMTKKFHSVVQPLRHLFVLIMLRKLNNYHINLKFWEFWVTFVDQELHKRLEGSRIIFILSYFKFGKKSKYKRNRAYSTLVYSSEMVHVKSF